MGVSAMTKGWDAEAIADLLEEFDIGHSWVRLQLVLIAANRAIVTRVVIGRLVAVQGQLGGLRETAGQLVTLDPARLYAGLEAWAERELTRESAAACPRPVLHVHPGGRS